MTPAMTPGQPMGAAPSSDDAGDDDTGGTTICIEVDKDGSLTVYSEPSESDAAGAAGEAPENEANENEKPAANIGEALKMVLDLYKSITANTGDKQFDAGFAGTAPKRAAPPQSRGVTGGWQ